MSNYYDEEMVVDLENDFYEDEDWNYDAELYEVKTRTKYIDPQTAMYRLYDRLAEAGVIW